jgi:hypothetical protein
MLRPKEIERVEAITLPNDDQFSNEQNERHEESLNIRTVTQVSHGLWLQNEEMTKR